ncbi:MAG TPA: hypothetical protein ACFYEK_04310 [Candidatus Wunengus sp. YC60]|uniref:hypothetical protein n=1 Tax=Candidatus Wunengus sp. YC60 TaxID=3367697 RepID=UPI00402730C7
MSETQERLLSPSEVIQILNIPRHRLSYLFDTRKLKSEEFTRLGNGRFVFRQSDLGKIKKALFAVGAK